MDSCWVSFLYLVTIEKHTLQACFENLGWWSRSVFACCSCEPCAALGAATWHRNKQAEVYHKQPTIVSFKFTCFFAGVRLFPQKADSRPKLWEKAQFQTKLIVNFLQHEDVMMSVMRLLFLCTRMTVVAAQQMQG